MIIQIVRYKSGLSDNDVLNTYKERSTWYLGVKGLLQKYYLRYSTGEYGAVFLWDSEESLQEFRKSELARSISTAYQVQGEPQSEVVAVVMSLRPDLVPEPAALGDDMS